jgi:hypothetical protein
MAARIPVSPKGCRYQPALTGAVLAPADPDLLRTGTIVSMLAMAGLIGSRWCGPYSARVRAAVTILYIAAILALVALDLFVQ